jgi:hypothetical protein
MAATGTGNAAEQNEVTRLGYQFFGQVPKRRNGEDYHPPQTHPANHYIYLAHLPGKDVLQRQKAAEPALQGPSQLPIRPGLH